MVDWEPSYPGIERLARASNPGVGAVDKRSVRGTAGEDSVAQVGMPWGRLRGKLDSTRSEEPGRIHFAWGELAVAGLSASVGVAHGMTWCELDLEKTGGSPMSSFENVPGVALRQKSLRRQHLAGRKRGVRKAGSSGLAVLLNPPSSYDICDSPFFAGGSQKKDKPTTKLVSKPMIRSDDVLKQRKGYRNRS